jgi:hypothetical protein
MIEDESSHIPTKGRDQKFPMICRFAKVWHFTGLLISSFSWAVELFCASILSAGKSQGCEQYSGLCAAYRLYGRRCLWTGFTVTTTVNRSSQILTGVVFLFFSGLLTVYLRIGTVGRGN